MFQLPVLWAEDKPNLGSKLVAVKIKLFTVQLVVTECSQTLYCYTNWDVAHFKKLVFYCLTLKTKAP